jgi:hypothetical protein
MRKRVITINVRVIYGPYSKFENHDLFGYTYIPAEQKNKESLQKQEKSDENNKVQLNTMKTENEVEITKSKSSGFLYIKRG